MPDSLHFDIPTGHAGKRLDQSLAELLANFIIVFVGFMLVNVYWTKIQEEKKHKDKDKFFRDLLQTLKTSVDKANELMKVNYQSKKDVTERDQLFKNEWEKVKSLATIINEFVDSNHDISSWTFKGWTFFITENRFVQSGDGEGYTDIRMRYCFSGSIFDNELLLGNQRLPIIVRLWGIFFP